jgi:kynureninase
VIDLGPYPDESGYVEAQELDAADALAEWRDEFVVTDPTLIYLDGNSLGRQPAGARQVIDDAVDRQWGDRLIRSWKEGWWDLQLRLGDLLAPIIGAGTGSVVISDATSVNLYKLAMAALAARPGRSRIITDDLNFPTDVYVLQGAAALEGRSLEIVPSDGILGPEGEIVAALDENVALVSLSHTVFKSGYVYDMARITAATHDVGAMVLWDLSHSAGSVQVDLAGTNADLAVGCTYKYLNGGPGSPAFLYVRKDLQTELRNPITAWWGHADPFAFDLGFEPIDGIRRFHTGTMPIVSLAAIEPGIAMIAEVGMAAIRAKSVALTEFFVEQSRSHLEPLGFTLASPADPERRGSHISLAHPRGWQITQAMIDRAKVLPDFRAPDNLRFGLAPLTTSFSDLHTALVRIRRLVEAGVHEEYRDERRTVT